MSTIKGFDHLRFSLDAIKLATNNFSEENFINRGGFGKVYKGELVLHGKSVMVAIKRLEYRTCGQGAPEFWKEITMLSQYRHENLVTLLGFCEEGREKILVYEYLSNKSLDLYLNTNLSWIQRLKICIGAARGLEYLHNPHGTMQRVLHCDIKSSNILLDENWNAKISDFGLSKLGPANQEHTFLVTNAAGTLGYIDPLYIETGFLTKESDIYSFGVVLFEVLCGRSCFMNYDDSRTFLCKLTQNCYEENNIGTIVPDFLRKQIVPDCLHRYANIAYQCLQKDRNERPSGAYIVEQLENAFQYQYQNKHNLKNVQPTVCVAAHAPARTQAAFGANSCRPRAKAAFEYGDTDENQQHVIEIIKIQRAYRCYRERKRTAEAALIQYEAALMQHFFRKWKTRSDYKKRYQVIDVHSGSIVNATAVASGKFMMMLLILLFMLLSSFLLL